MSWEAETWAKRQRTGSMALKAVLVSLSNWINPRNDWFETSIKRLSDELETSERSVQRYMATLEELGFIERQERFSTSHNGRQGWNAYRLRGYAPPKLSHVEPIGQGDRLAPSPVTPLSPSPVTPLSPPIMNLETNPPQPTAVAPKGAAGRDRGSRLPDDWAPPSVAELPPAARSVASGWPAGAYAMVAERFRNHWHSRADRSAKRDWAKAWAEWVLKSPRDVAEWQRAGVDFSAMQGGAGPVSGAVGKDGCERAGAIRAALAAAVEPGKYRGWLAALDFSVSGKRLVIGSDSRVRLDHVKNDGLLAGALRRAAGGLELHWYHQKGGNRG